MAIVCVVGDGLHAIRRWRRSVLGVGRRRAAAHGVAGGVAPEHHVRDPRGASCRRRSAGCTIGSSRATCRRRADIRVLTRPRPAAVGTARMGPLVEHWRAVRRRRSPASSTSARATGPSPTATSARSTWPSTSRCADAVVANLPQLAGAADQRGDRHHGLAGARSARMREMAARRRHRRAGGVELLARHERVPAGRWKRPAAGSRTTPSSAPGSTRRITPMKKDAPSGTALTLEGRHGGRRLRAADRRVVDAGRLRCPARTRSASTARRRPSTLTHTVRDRAVFARGALDGRARGWSGRHGWFFDAWT